MTISRGNVIMKTYIEKAINADITQQKAVDRAHGKSVQTLFSLCAHVADKADIKEYLEGWAEAMKQLGRPESSVKVEKSNRKLIVEFATGNKKGCEISRDEAVNLINNWLPTCNSVDLLAKAIREHLNGTPNNPEFDLAKEVAKLITKAEEAGVTPETIRTAVINALIPDSE
jgi:hypothetical protein